MAFSLNYQDYVSSQPAGAVDGGSEGGQGTSSLMSQDAWNNLSDDDKWHAIGDGIAIGKSDPRYADLAKELNVTNGREILGGYRSPDDKAANDPSMYVDPSRFASQGNARFTPGDNLSPQAQASTGVSDWFWPLAFIAGAVGGTALANAGILSGPAVTGAEATAAGGITSGADIAASGAATTAGTAGTAGAVVPPGAEVGPPASLAPEPPPPSGMPPGADVGPPSGLAPEPGVTPPPGADVGPPGSLAPEPTPGVTPPGADVGPPSNLAPAPGTSTGAPVTDVSVPAQPGPAPVTDASVPAQGNGLINGARATGNSVGTWYNNLSPASRLILGTAVSTGARGAFTALAQRNANQAAVDAENRHRQDVIRQGQVPLLPPGTFTPKPPGG